MPFPFRNSRPSDTVVVTGALEGIKNTFVTNRLARGATGYGCSDDVTQPLSVMGYLGTWTLPATIAERPPASRHASTTSP